MLLNLTHIGQIGLPVADVDRSEAFYRDVLGLPKQYRFGGSAPAGEIKRGHPARLHLLSLRRHRAHRR
jgi:catechol 2,3-dioxygenase-like lactoylglutathione lyase family enzyme